MVINIKHIQIESLKSLVTFMIQLYALKLRCLKLHYTATNITEQRVLPADFGKVSQRDSTSACKFVIGFVLVNKNPMCSQAYFMFDDVKQPQIYKVLAISLACSAISVGNGQTDVTNVKFNFQLYN